MLTHYLWNAVACHVLCNQAKGGGTQPSSSLRAEVRVISVKERNKQYYGEEKWVQAEE